MADTYSIGLPNQGLKQLTSTFSNSVTQTAPVEYLIASVNLGVGVETNLVATKTVAANQKITLNSLNVSVPIADTIIKLYRNGTVVESWTPKTINTSIELFPVGGGKEFDETETWRITATSATGIAENVTGSVSGRTELKRNELFSQVLA
jgi:hypothetical protein